MSLLSAMPATLPELMAPAGDWDCARAAVENGADAVYFGMQGGFNARAKAVNFTAAELPDLMAFLHARGVKGYLTLNTLVFTEELEEAERTARVAIEAGIDAVLVQDLGLLRLLHRLCPDLPLHASTQMTLSSAACLREVEAFGVRRVVLPRELSIAEIAALRRQTEIELEVFVHGALCISYSGQCLASLSLGGRSANRGQCAQPCRLPYEIVGDGCPQEVKGKKYPLSPRDLAAYDRLPDLLAAGVSALKIEGRLKPADYVATVTRHYRAVLDAAIAGQPAQLGPTEVAELEAVFSRGFCRGWLDGHDPRALVSGESSAHRGVYLGEVVAVRGQRVAVRLAAPVQRGDGLVFEGDRSQDAEIGGRVFEVYQGGRSLKESVCTGIVDLAFRHGAIDFSRIRPGQNVWKTDDPRLSRRIRKTYATGIPHRRIALELTVTGTLGKPLQVAAVAATGTVCRVESSQPLVEATKHPLTPEVLAEQFGRLGRTPYALERLNADLDGRVMVPLSILGRMRRELLQGLDAAAKQPPVRTVIEGSARLLLRLELESLNGAASLSGNEAAAPPHLHVLCRSLEQIEAAMACGASSIIAELRDIRRCQDAVSLARNGGAAVWLAAPRIHREESRALEFLVRQQADGLLVRNLAGLAFCRRERASFTADFSLNAVNELTAHALLALGACRVTPAYDLNPDQLFNLAESIPGRSLEVVVHRHTPMFHTEHCLFCWALSSGKDRRDCGHPCEKHRVQLRDRLGVAHELRADGDCRNTVFHSQAENLVAILPGLRERGVSHFRVELLAERSPEEIRRILDPLQRCLGRCA